MSATVAGQPRRAWSLVGSAWDRLSVYLPIILMGMIALGTYWLARNTPSLAVVEAPRPPTHDPDTVMRGFSVKTFDPAGRLKSEVHGKEARHFPDTDTVEIDEPRIRSLNAQGDLTVATAQRALSNADGSEVQLFGNAVVTRTPAAAGGQPRPPLEFRGDFLHAFLDAERLVSHKPVELRRGDDRFTGDSLQYDNINRVLVLEGQVRGTIAARQGG